MYVTSRVNCKEMSLLTPKDKIICFWVLILSDLNIFYFQQDIIFPKLKYS